MKRSEIKVIIPGVTDDQLDALLKLHGIDIQDEQAKLNGAVPKKDYEAVTAELAALKEVKPKDYTAELSELEVLRKYKTDNETKIIRDNQMKVLSSELDSIKVDPKAKGLIISEFEKRNSKYELELNDKGEPAKIKGFADLIKPIQTEYADFFGKEEVVYAKPGSAPANTIPPNVKPEEMTMEQYVAWREKQ